MVEHQPAMRARRPAGTIASRNARGTPPPNGMACLFGRLPGRVATRALPRGAISYKHTADVRTWLFGHMQGVWDTVGERLLLLLAPTLTRR